MHHVLARVDAHRIALPALEVVEMLPMPEIHHAPRAQNVRGVVRARGHTLLLVSGRDLFGLPPAAEAASELVSILQTRRQDHERWIAELAACIRENRPFTLATDPTQCGFGKWYAGFKTDDPMLSSHMRHFDEPHKAIHGLAHQVLRQAQAGDADGALEAVELARGRVLAKLIQLFHVAEGLVQQAFQEIAMVMRCGDVSFVLGVDQVDTLVEIGPDGVDEVTGAQEAAGVVGFAHLDDDLVLVIEPSRIVSELGVLQPA